MLAQRYAKIFSKEAQRAILEYSLKLSSFATKYLLITLRLSLFGHYQILISKLIQSTFVEYTLVSKKDSSHQFVIFST